MKSHHLLLCIYIIFYNFDASAGGINKFFGDMTTVESTAEGCPTFTFDLKGNHKKGGIRFSDNPDRLRIRDCVDLVYGKGELLKRDEYSSIHINSDNFTEYSNALLYGKPLESYTERNFCSVASFANACKEFLDENDKRLYIDVISGLNTAKNIKAQIDKVSAEVAVKAEEKKAEPDIWSENSCIALNIPKSMNVKGSQVGFVCALSQELLNSTISEAEVKHSVTGLSSLYLEGLSLREGLQKIRSFAQNSTNNSASGIVMAVIQVQEYDGITKIQVFADPNGSDLNKDMFVEIIKRTFCGADPTNSLNGGSSFRKSLIDRYGAPKTENRAREMAKSLTIERDKKLAALNKVVPPPGHEALHREIVSNFLLSYQSVIDHYTSMGDKTASLEWNNPSGDVLKISDFPGDCSTGRNFIMELSTPTSMSWYKNVMQNQVSNEEDRSRDAAIPTF